MKKNGLSKSSLSSSFTLYPLIIQWENVTYIKSNTLVIGVAQVKVGSSRNSELTVLVHMKVTS